MVVLNETAIRPFLWDTRGEVKIGQPLTPQEEALVVAGATEILHSKKTGAFAGVYIDNETPDRDGVATELATKYHGARVVVGLYPSEPAHRIPGCVCALEWYPYHQGWGMPTRTNLGLRSSQPSPVAWILQWNYAWPDDTPPTVTQKRALLAWVDRYHPRAELVWVY